MRVSNGERAALGWRSGAFRWPPPRLTHAIWGGDQGSYDTADNVFGIIFQLGDSLLYWLVQVLPLNGNAEFRPVEVLFRWISRCNV